MLKDFTCTSICKASRECILGVVADDLKHLFNLILLPEGVGFQGHWMIGHWKKTMLQVERLIPPLKRWTTSRLSVNEAVRAPAS